MANDKHNYSGDSFYDEIFALAMQGQTDAEIADSLNLAPEVFSRMKNGKYEGWTKEKNKRYGARISQVLARARRRVNSIVRGAYLKAALGGKVLKSKTTVSRKMKLPDGTISEIDEIQVSESEQEMPYNIQAMSTWLHHHDDEWRKIDRGLDDEASGTPTNIEKGVNIDSWIKKEIGK